MKQTANDSLVVGGEPRVDLLPPEIRAERRDRLRRRRLGFGVIGVVVVTLLGVGAATFVATTAQVRLQSEQERTVSLLAEQAQYSEIRQMQTQVELARAAQQVGASTEIDWQDYLQEVQATLPDSVFVETVDVDSASPLIAYTQATAPLQGARMATVEFTAASLVLPDVPTWLRALATLPGFADALPGSVTRADSSGVYTVTITMHINDAALAQRFTAEGEK
ncbi:hypothetical protein D6T64_10415 [Cryobacterium melibiosiphilum]|uniref:Tfp pilus assembly protein PilN n=1 Tax=Cryobacterium melibiosiphilum TaxID=995039 RepID=A0A3A5MI36_9MICO|nr:hypothetical protein [Cryobacterium melibiosiphilum]RJT88531.1 hypothetical protein D6T64_10415 [Cryobacterium melibiosiphilum]